MALGDLIQVKKIFGVSTEVKADAEVYREFMLMVLARATDVDAYTHPAEVEVVQRVLEEHLGERVKSSDVRIAAHSKLYETAPLERYISRVGLRFSKRERCGLVSALIEVLRADGHVATAEVEYFNMVVSALELDFAEAAGLTRNWPCSE